MGWTDHRNSAASLHAARTVLRHYALTPQSDEFVRGRGGRPMPVLRTQPTEVAVARFIDLITNAHLIAELRPQFHHWQMQVWHNANEPALPKQLRGFVDHMVREMEKVPKNPAALINAAAKNGNARAPKTEGLGWVKAILPAVGKFAAQIGVPTRETPENAFTISEATRQVVGYLFTYYAFTPIGNRVMNAAKLMEMDVYRMIEASMGLTCEGGAMEALPMARKLRDGLDKGNLEVDDIKLIMREMGVRLNKLTHYHHYEEQTKMLL